MYGRPPALGAWIEIRKRKEVVMTEQEVRLEMLQLTIREMDHRATISDLEAKVARILLDKKRLEAKYLGQLVLAGKGEERKAAKTAAASAETPMEAADVPRDAGPPLKIVK